MAILSDTADVMKSRQSPWRTLIPFRCTSSKSKEVPVHRVGLLSFLSYAWLDRLMWRLFRQNYSDIDADWDCPESEQAVVNADRLERIWQEEVAKNGLSDASLSRAFKRFMKSRFLVAALSLVLSIGLLLFGVAYILSTVMKLTTTSNHDDLWKGVVLVGSLLIVNVLSALFFIAASTLGHITGGRLRAGVLCLLFRKLLRANRMQDETIGKIINLYANDGQRIFDGVSMAPNLIVGPLVVLGATAYAIYLLGAWALIGFGILLLVLPLQMFVGKTFMMFRGRAILLTDKRVRVMVEYLTNIRFIKMYCWEEPLSKLLANIRSVEQSVLERVNVSLSLAIMSPAILTSVATMITLVAYTAGGNHLSGVEGFMYLLIYSSIQDKLEFCMMSIKMVSEMFVAAGRFQVVFKLEELNDCSFTGGYQTVEQNFNAIEAVDVATSWPYVRQSAATKPSKINEMNNTHHEPERVRKKINEKVKSNNVKEKELMVEKANGVDELVPGVDQVFSDSFSFKITKGSLIGITGPVGSGKTALLKTILGHMNIKSGMMTVAGSIAYAPQQPWIFNDSVRSNIILNNSFDKERYSRVLKACSLDEELSSLPQGDNTIVGERGVTLSGGQRQRVSLARVAYSQRDLCLLDDPFASVDPDVTNTIFQRLLLDVLLGKTILLVTHQTKILARCDTIIYLPGDGRPMDVGCHEELMKSPTGDYAIYINSHSKQQTMEKDTDRNIVQYDHTVEKHDNSITSTAVLEDCDDSDERSQLTSLKPDPNNALDSKSSTASFERWPCNAVKSPSQIRHSATVQSGNDQEEQRESLVTCQTYLTYVGAAGGIIAIVVVVFASLIAEGARAFSFWWLAHWLDQGSGNTTVTRGNVTSISDNIGDNPQLWMYNLVYGMSLVAIVIFFTGRCVILTKMLMRAASRLHDRLFMSAMRAPVLFFDSTPLGRIINRFSRDMDEMDTRLPMLIDQTLRTLLNILIYIGLIAAITPWFLLALPPAFCAFLLIYAVFRAGIRQLQRQQLASMSPLLAHVDATVHGLASIHAYGLADVFSSRFQRTFDNNTLRLMLSSFASRWVNVRLSFVTTTLVSITALLMFLLRHVIPTAYAGAALVYAVQLLTLLQLFVRFAVDTEATFTSTERVRKYIAELPQEGSMKAKTLDVPNKWPEAGKIEFSNYQLRFSASSPLVLKNVSFVVRPREKIGIVGRTGSGKTSLVSALFRLNENIGGHIKIDDVDISTISLQDVRSSVSIIPQDSVLFSGTIRSNLDPFNRHTDAEIWDALEKCHMKEAVIAADCQLLCPMADSGANFSHGERQLLCMARVLLRHAKIVVLDEATASLDPETAKRVNEIIHQTFADSTVLIVAHSMKTVLYCDRVLVMSNGKVVEFDQPKVLLSNHESYFSRLVASSDTWTNVDDSGLQNKCNDINRNVAV